jgi:flagellar basal body P-ring protein FlgI
VITTKDVVALDTTSQGGAKLRDLVDALEQLKVPAEDRITIIKKLHKIGKLHAKLIIE